MPVMNHECSNLLQSTLNFCLQCFDIVSSTLVGWEEGHLAHILCFITPLGRQFT